MTVNPILDPVTPSLTYVITVFLGLVLGSFANVIIYRVPRGQSVVRPGSRCPRCRKPIRWWGNIPLFSFLFLRGRCQSCEKPISIRYPVVELLMALLFLTARIKFGWNASLFLREWPFLFSLLSITFIDLEHRIVPDALSLSGIGLGLATSWLPSATGPALSVAGAALGFGIFYVLAWAYYRYRGASGLGGGDVKLLAMLGAYLGPMGVFATIMISSISGSVVGLALARVRGEKEVLKSSIPFGPFLVLGGLYYHFLGDVLWFQFTIPT